jgi:hypothetical protein
MAVEASIVSGDPVSSAFKSPELAGEQVHSPDEHFGIGVCHPEGSGT